MRRLIGGDWKRRAEAISPGWVIELAVTLMCIGLSGLLRVLLDVLAPGALPFGLVYPVALLATLLAGWRAGLATLLTAGLAAWYFVLPPRFSFALNDHATAVSVAAFFVSGAIEVALAAAMMSELQARLAERDLLLREVDHRVKNNFQMVVSLLELQAFKAEDPALKAGLSDAARRVIGVARAHRRLYSAGASSEFIDLGAYLRELCDDLADAGLSGASVAIVCQADPFRISRDRAVAIGAIVNELVTNAQKHAFTQAEAGTIKIILQADSSGAAVTVSDNGSGLPDDYQARSGLGHRLMSGLVRQAEGVLTTNPGPGASFTLKLSA